MASDVANAIVKSSKEAYEEYCKASECELQVTMRLVRRPQQVDRCQPYIITVVPTEHHVVFKYGGLCFRAPRADREAFQGAVSSLYGMLMDKCKEADREDKRLDHFAEWYNDVLEEWDNFLGGGDPYGEATFRILRCGEVQVEVTRMPLEELEGVFMRHVGAMRFLSCC